MSEATDKRVVSCVLDIIYNVTHGKVKTPKRIGLAVLVRILTGSADLVKVRQILSRVGDSFDITNRSPPKCGKFPMCCLRFSVNW
jgi:hypothetical protein